VESVHSKRCLLLPNPEASTQARAITRSHINDLFKQWSSAPLLSDTAESSIVPPSFSASRTSIVIQKSLFGQADCSPPGMPIGDDEVF